MAFERHRQKEVKTSEEKKPKLNITWLKEQVKGYKPGNLPEEVKPEEKIPEIKTPEEKIPEVKKQKAKKLKLKRHFDTKVILNPEEKLPEEKKNRIDKKKYCDVGVLGSTIEVREFRAIVKKKGLQINTVLNKILHDWNTKNYNL
jgi:hypothetical protein